MNAHSRTLRTDYYLRDVNVLDTLAIIPMEESLAYFGDTVTSYFKDGVCIKNLTTLTERQFILPFEGLVRELGMVGVIGRVERSTGESSYSTRLSSLLWSTNPSEAFLEGSEDMDRYLHGALVEDGYEYIVPSWGPEPEYSL